MVVRVGLRFAALVVLLLPAVVLGAETADLDALAKSLDARQLDEVQARAQTLPPSLERDTVWVTAVILQKGPEEGISFAATLVSSEKERPAVLAGATLRCPRLREYDSVAKLMRVVMEREPSMKKQERMGSSSRSSRRSTARCSTGWPVAPGRRSRSMGSLGESATSSTSCSSSLSDLLAADDHRR
ncbi:MAG TPA: hypothetical protein VGF41_13895, partial [Myxococcaceae bacterium]